MQQQVYGPDRSDLYEAMFQEADRLKRFRNEEALSVCRHLQAGNEECARWVMTTFFEPAEAKHKALVAKQTELVKSWMKEWEQGK
ncbi:hypothetical protein [Chromobacterium sp. Beijing]|uniref:hypothetical protein n=1 Tax=Chromobacterium sp. Beijing TaxID=2735795 RepID=UPI001F2BCBB6|nr:hypothetical protein [Chromobacterium sp. Beijing]UJB33728.1 hypothetical protein HQN78_23290 [Chromobacterium sp. Beijing]